MNADLSSSSSIPSTGVNPEQDISRKGNFLMDEGFVYITLGFAVIAAGLIFWMAAIITQKAWPALQTFGISFIWSTDWSVPAEKFGALPYIFGTLVTAGIALLLAVPIGISVALITSENFLPQWVRTPLGFIVELIAAIPSVIIGLWGIFVFIPVFLPVQQFLHQTLGWFPLFSSEPPGPGILVAGLILTVMILPTISSISRDVLRSVPVTLRSASMALGATRWETLFRVMLPAAAS
ncbi:MAG: PstC family ABC transporter permease, partial [Synechococcales cyanobacterium]